MNYRSINCVNSLLWMQRRQCVRNYEKNLFIFSLSIFAIKSIFCSAQTDVIGHCFDNLLTKDRKLKCLIIITIITTLFKCQCIWQCCAVALWIPKQLLQMELKLVKNSTVGRLLTSWLFTSVVKELKLAIGMLQIQPVAWGPFLESPGKFSGPKSHFKTHEALDVQSFLFRQVLHLNKAYTYAAFRI